jgi:hypothetical protein
MDQYVAESPPAVSNPQKIEKSYKRYGKYAVSPYALYRQKKMMKLK